MTIEYRMKGTRRRRRFTPEKTGFEAGGSGMVPRFLAAVDAKNRHTSDYAGNRAFPVVEAIKKAAGKAASARHF